MSAVDLPRLLLIPSGESLMRVVNYDRKPRSVLSETGNLQYISKTSRIASRTSPSAFHLKHSFLFNFPYNIPWQLMPVDDKTLKYVSTCINTARPRSLKFEGLR